MCESERERGGEPAGDVAGDYAEADPDEEKGVRRRRKGPVGQRWSLPIGVRAWSF